MLPSRLAQLQPAEVVRQPIGQPAKLSKSNKAAGGIALADFPITGVAVLIPKPLNRPVGLSRLLERLRVAQAIKLRPAAETLKHLEALAGGKGRLGGTANSRLCHVSLGVALPPLAV